MEHKRGREDYLRLIFELENGKGVRSIDIASSLKISKASVSEMLRKLAKDKLINLKPYSKILLTKKGKEQAEYLEDRHFAIKSFIKKFFNYENKKAMEEAHKLEHAFSQESVEIISRLADSQVREIKSLPSYVS